MAQTEKLPFGESHWDYLPDLVQNYIQDLAARSLHRDRMGHVCQSIKFYQQWRFQRWPTEWSPNQEIFSLRDFGKGKRLFFIESAINVQLKGFSPEIVLSKHRSICRGLVFEDPEELMDFYERFFEIDEFFSSV